MKVKEGLYVGPEFGAAAAYSKPMTAQTQVEQPSEPMPTAQVVLLNIPWWQYLAIREATEGQGLRMTYLDGALEIMPPPSELHEQSKTVISRLLETWAVERRVSLNGIGSTTWRSEAKSAGAEGDEAYRLGKQPAGTPPDLVIEVVVTSGLGARKREVYARLGVRELWTWMAEKRELVVQHIVGDSYCERPTSALLPQLDLAQLVSFASRATEDQTELILAYRATL